MFVKGEAFGVLTTLGQVSASQEVNGIGVFLPLACNALGRVIGTDAIEIPVLEARISHLVIVVYVVAQNALRCHTSQASLSAVDS